MKTQPAKYPPHRNHEEVVVEILRDDPEAAAEYLNQVLTDGDQAEILLAIRYLVPDRKPPFLKIGFLNF